MGASGNNARLNPDLRIGICTSERRSKHGSPPYLFIEVRGMVMPPYIEKSQCIWVIGSIGPYFNLEGITLSISHWRALRR